MALTINESARLMTYFFIKLYCLLDTGNFLRDIRLMQLPRRTIRDVVSNEVCCREKHLLDVGESSARCGFQDADVAGWYTTQMVVPSAYLHCRQRWTVILSCGNRDLICFILPLMGKSCGFFILRQAHILVLSRS